jgi:hypothetical protein
MYLGYRIDERRHQEIKRQLKERLGMEGLP